MVEQETRSNPFGMDADCRRCDALCASRSRVVHGYGDVGAEFLVVGESPSAGADETGVPFAGDAGRGILDVLDELGFVAEEGTEGDDEDGSGGEDVSDSDPDPTAVGPALENVYLTYLARCHHPDRGPTDTEVRECEGYLTAEVRMLNPEVIVPVGERVLSALAPEYTTRAAADFDIERDHATTIRGRGFELLPMRAPDRQTEADREAFREAFASLLDRDYRQTKGRRSR